MVEFWDVGGSAMHLKSRGMFYGVADGLLLVYDASSSRSYASIDRWVEELKSSGIAE